MQGMWPRWEGGKEFGYHVREQHPDEERSIAYGAWQQRSRHQLGFRVYSSKRRGKKIRVLNRNVKLQIDQSRSDYFVSLIWIGFSSALRVLMFGWIELVVKGTEARLDSRVYHSFFECCNGPNMRLAARWTFVHRSWRRCALALGRRGGGISRTWRAGCLLFVFGYDHGF